MIGQYNDLIRRHFATKRAEYIAAGETVADARRLARSATRKTFIEAAGDVLNEHQQQRVRRALREELSNG